MKTSVNLTKAGMGIDEATVVRWLRAEGEFVNEGELLVEVETAKATQEIEAPATGILRHILVREGQTVEVDTELAIIDDDNA